MQNHRKHLTKHKTTLREDTGKGRIMTPVGRGSAKSGLCAIMNEHWLDRGISRLHMGFAMFTKVTM